MKLQRIARFAFALSAMAACSHPAMAQGPAGTGSSSPAAPQGTAPAQPAPAYVRPTSKTKLHNYLFDTFGPYPIVGAAFTAGINQADTTPPEWKQGWGAYGERFGSNFGIATTATTTRYALAAAFREDTIYYRCDCTGVVRRLEHAVISTVTARRGEDGHRQFSVPAVIAPYAGTMTAVYGWYPNRYGYKDGFRLGNYTLLGYLGQNIATEFLYGGPHTLLSRLHLPGANH